MFGGIFTTKMTQLCRRKFHKWSIWVCNITKNGTIKYSNNVRNNLKGLKQHCLMIDASDNAGNAREAYWNVSLTMPMV